MSFYFIELLNNDIDKVCSSRRLDIRKIWKLPFNTHCSIVSSICGRPPLFDELCRKCITFCFACSNHDNSTTVNTVGSYALNYGFASSPLGCHLLHICNRYNLKFEPFITGCLTNNCINNCIEPFNTLLYRVKPESNRAINLLLELIVVRGRTFELSVLKGDEVINLVKFIRTS